MGVFEAVPKHVISSNVPAMINQLSNLCDSLLHENLGLLSDYKKFENIFIQSIIWSFGSTLLENDRERFSDVIKKLSGLNLTAHDGSQIKSLYDYFYDTTRDDWVTWESIVPEYTHDRNLSFFDILVPTSETVRYFWLLEKFDTIKKPVIFCGDVESSKTVTIKNFTKKLSRDLNTVLDVNFSSRTSAVDVQKIIEANVEKKSKDIFGPLGGKRLAILLDDLNMPSKDTYGTQQPIALLKLFIERGGLYDKGKDLSWKNVKDVTFLASMVILSV